MIAVSKTNNAMKLLVITLVLNLLKAIKNEKITITLDYFT